MDNETGTKAFKCLQALLKGETLHRKKLGDMGIADNNDSLHSYASYLRHQRLIPVESTKNSDGTCDYFMLPREIDRFRNLVSRIQQKEEMRSLIERERQEKLIEDFFRFLTRLNEFPILWNFWCDLPLRLAEISTDINALLNHEESVNQ